MEVGTLSVLYSVDWGLTSPLFPQQDPKPLLLPRTGSEILQCKFHSTGACSQIGCSLQAERGTRMKPLVENTTFQGENSISPPLEQIWSLPFYLQWAEVICPRTQKYLSLEHSYFICPLENMGTQLPWTGWCHLENSFWVINQNPSREKR